MSIDRPESAAPMRSCHTAPTARRVERELRPIYPPQASSDGVRRQRERTSGFTLLEIVAVTAIVAMLAAIILPLAPRGTSRQRLAAYAVEAAALLKADRTAAVRRNAQVNAQIDAPSRVIRCGSTGRALQIPGDVAFQALLPLTCNERPARSTISFFATGMSCGGTIVLARLGVGFEVRVNWLTGGVEIVTRE